MAEDQIVTRIVATADFSNLIVDLNKVSSALTNLQTKLNATNKNLSAQAAVMNRSFAETMRSTGQFSTHFVNLQSDVEKFGSQLDKGQIKLRQFFQVYQGHVKTNSGIVRQLAAQQVQLQNAILQPLGKNSEGLMQYNVHIPTGLDKVKNRTALARQELQIMNRVIQEGANSLINWGKNTQWAGRQLTVGLTIPLAAFGKASADAFRTADQELTRLTKVYGGLTAKSSLELAKIRADVSATASELAKGYGASFKETLGLAADIAATGKEGDDLLGSIKETTRLAVLGEVDRQDAMKATLAIQSAFKQNTDELAESINFLNAVENQTSTTLGDLVEAIPKAGPVIKGLGGSVQDLALYLTAMREGGINATEGANALKSALASLINPTDVAIDKFSEFGINLKAIVNDNAGNVTDTLLALQQGLDNLNPLQKSQAIEQLFGKFQFARISALFENLGKQGSQTLEVMDLMKASSQDLANIAGRELAMVTESASGKYKRALESLKAELAGVGEQFLTINTHLINIVSGILKFIDKLPAPLKSLLAFFGGLTAVAGPLIMLTGVLANFFGYIIKGASQFRALFKGGAGWKLLTPDILAANKAGALVEATFYSDAKAADILQQSITRLSASYNKLATDANSAIIATNPGVSTMAGNSVIAAGGRSVNPNSAYVGAVGTRAAAHHNPVSGMAKDQKNNQTIHSFTPQPIPVNQKIGAVPQIFASGDLPKIEGLTTSRGVSTGIVAGEAAKWHALMGTLSMMSKREVADLKKEIARTGTFSADINSTFGQLLPAMTKLTTNAASQSAAVVAQLKAGKINLDAARAKIIAINAELEMLMSQTTSQMAASMGKTANLTQVPLINQPVVSPKGKANIKEIFRAKRPSAQIIDKIARALGVRTYGAGYSTETTIPKMNTGGIVPGTGNTDTYHTTLPEGAFVVNKQATAENMDILRPMMGMNKGGEVPVVLTPGEAVIDPYTAQNNIKTLYAINGPGAQGPGYIKGGKISLQRTHITDDLSGLALLLPKWVNMGVNANGEGLTGSRIASGIRETLNAGYDPSDLMNEAAVTLGGDKSQASKINKKALNRLLIVLEEEKNSNRLIGGKNDPFGFEKLAKRIYQPALRGIKIDPSKAGGLTNLYSAISQIFTRRSKKVLTRDEAITRGILSGKKTGSKEMGEIVERKDGRKTWVGQNKTIGSNVPSWARGTNLPTLLTTASGISHALKIIDKNNPKSPQTRAPLPPVPGKFNPYARGIHPNNYSIPSHGRSAFLGMPLKKLAQGWANPRYIAPDPRSEALTRKWKMGYNRGGMVGGSQAAPRGYNAGGMIAQMLLPMLGYMGGQSIGTQVGGTGGGFAGGMIGSMIPSMFMGSMGANRTKTAPGSDEAYEKYGNRVGKSALANNKFSLSLANSAAQGSKVSRVLTTLIGGLTKTNLAVGGVTLALGVGYKKFRDYQEGVRLNVSTFGLTEEAAEKAGLKVTSYNSAIKDSIGTINATIERNKMLYESMNSAGIPIKMTIAEYKKLKEEVKISMSDSIEAINRMKETDLKDYAERLKAQMISAGASADEASKKIYAAFALSEKFALAGSSTLGNMGFNNIKDGITAAIEAYEVFNDTVKNESPDAQGMALTTSLDAVNKAIEESIALSEKKAKADKSGKTVVISRSQAEIEVINKIKSKVSEQTNVSQGLLNSIFDQNKEAKKFLSLQDTALSVMQKLRLQAQGYTGDLSMGALAADRLFSMRAAIESKVTAFSTSESGPLFGISQKLKIAQEQYKKLGLASQGASVKQQIDSRKAGEAIDAKIKKIQEEADARRKALTQTLKDEDFLTQVKKKQLEYQDALAAGDMSRAAQAQLDIKSMNKQQQTDKAMQSIDDKEKFDIGKLESQRKALSDANQKLADSASLAGNGLQKFAKEIEGYQSTISKYNNSLTNYLTLLNSNDGKKSMEGPAAEFLNEIKNLPGVTLPNKFAGPRPKSSTEMAYEVVSGYSELLKTINADSAVINVKSAIIDEKKNADVKNVRPMGTTGKGGSGFIPRPSATTVYGKDPVVPRYQTGSTYTYSAPVAPVKKSMGGLIKMSSIPKMSSGGPVINTVPRYNKGGIVNSSNSSSSSSVRIETLSINYPTAPTNAKEFFAQVEEIARQKGIKVLAGGRSV
jgi:TP901 family phage tail tape measure protein